MPGRHLDGYPPTRDLAKPIATQLRVIRRSRIVVGLQTLMTLTLDYFAPGENVLWMNPLVPLKSGLIRDPGHLLCIQIRQVLPLHSLGA